MFRLIVCVAALVAALVSLAPEASAHDRGQFRRFRQQRVVFVPVPQPVYAAPLAFGADHCSAQFGGYGAQLGFRYGAPLVLREHAVDFRDFRRDRRDFDFRRGRDFRDFRDFRRGGGVSRLLRAIGL